MKMKIKKNIKMKKIIKMKILRIDQDGYVSNKKIDISKLKLKLKLKLTPKKRKKYLEELAKIEMWCKKNR